MNRRRFNSQRSFKRFPQKRRSQHKSNDLVSAIRAATISTGSKTLQQETFVSTKNFSDFPFSEQLLNNIKDRGYTSLTPIQEQAIGPLIEGKDVIGIANTGTGKTAAFLLPLIQKVSNNNGEKVLIVTPTRELAVQIFDEFKQFARGLHIRAALCVGGMDIRRQKMDLGQNPNFVIGTPGRLRDHMQERSLTLSQFHTVVLDETDRMVDIGFINDIKYFISFLPQPRQSLFFSATVSGKVREILQGFVRNPVTVSVKQQETSQNVNQEIIKVRSDYKKIDTLHDLLVKDEFAKVLIFGRTKWGVQKLTDELIKRGFRASAIHGNKNQNQRQRALEQFKKNAIQILIATDVASRGLDIQDVSHVINYDMPESYEDYVHRIGRTGRANKTGTALTFVE